MKESEKEARQVAGRCHPILCPCLLSTLPPSHYNHRFCLAILGKYLASLG